MRWRTLQDNPVLWHFAPWRVGGRRRLLAWLFLVIAVCVPIFGLWLLGPRTPIKILDPSGMLSKNTEGMYSRIGLMMDIPMIVEWAWLFAMPLLTLLTWVLVIAAIYSLRLNLLQMGLLEQVYLTGLDRNRAAVGTIAWGGLLALAIVLATFLFQAVYLGVLFPVRLGYSGWYPNSGGTWSRGAQYESIPFGVGYAFVVLAASIGVWSRALLGALRQKSAPWSDAPRCIIAGLFVIVVIRAGMAILGHAPLRDSYEKLHTFVPSLMVLSLATIVVMTFVKIRTLERIGGRICFGPVNPELFEREDWWESERVHRGKPAPHVRPSGGEWGALFMVNLLGVALALVILSIVAQSVDLREMAFDYPYVVALMGLFAPAAHILFVRLRGPIGPHRPVRGHLIRSTLFGALPMLLAVCVGLSFFLWIAEGLNEGFRRRGTELAPYLTVAFGLGFGLMSHVSLLVRRGQTALLVTAAVIAVALMVTPLWIGGMVFFGIGLAAFCSLPAGLLSVLAQRIHDDLPPPDSPEVALASPPLPTMAVAQQSH
jgi:hypothetical protein